MQHIEEIVAKAYIGGTSFALWPSYQGQTGYTKVMLININDFTVEMADFANLLEHVLKAHLTATDDFGG